MRPTDPAAELADTGFVVLEDRFDDAARAWPEVRDLVASASERDLLDRALPPLTTVAEYTMPTAGAPVRDFQVLHFDFGLPLARAPQVDVARYTGLFVDPELPPSGTRTSIVRLADLAAQRSWPSVEAFAGRLHSRPDDPDATEGVLARVVEAAVGQTELPSKSTPGFLCGLEFDSVEAETCYFRRHDLSLAVHQVVVPPGGVLVFDNLRCAHGRSGRRSVGELHQLCLGYRGLTPDLQLVVLRHSLGTLTGESMRRPTGRRPRPAGTP